MESADKAGFDPSLIDACQQQREHVEKRQQSEESKGHNCTYARCMPNSNLYASLLAPHDFTNNLCTYERQ